MILNAQHLIHRFIFLLFVLMAMGVLQGCSKNIKIPASSETQKDWTPKQADRLWAVILKQAVDAKGQIDFSGLARNPSRLRAYVAYIGHNSPHNRPDLFPDLDRAGWRIT